MRQDLSRNWEILQDVHDTCEQLGLPEHEEFVTLQGPQISEWEPLPELKQLLEKACEAVSPIEKSE